MTFTISAGLDADARLATFTATGNGGLSSVVVTTDEVDSPRNECEGSWGWVRATQAVLWPASAHPKTHASKTLSD